MTFDPTKPVRTRDGRAARILATGLNLVADASIVAVITNKDGTQSVGYFRNDGIRINERTGTNRPYDLVNIPKRKIRYFELPSKAVGWLRGMPGFPCLRIVYEDGEAVSVELMKAGKSDDEIDL